MSQVTCLNRMRHILEWTGDLAGACVAEEPAVRIAGDSGDLWSLAWSLYWRGLCSSDTGRGETKELLEEALGLSRHLGCQQMTVFILVGLGRAAYLRRELTVAESHFSETLGVSGSLEE